MSDDITLSRSEIERITRYTQPARQLTELQRQGFYRARRSPRTGEVIVERSHYDAVCAGAKEAPKPKVKPPVLRTA